MWTLVKVVEFDAAHYLPDHPGKCKKLHGHRWKVTVEIKAAVIDDSGMVLDFGTIKSVITSRFDHVCINDKPPFHKVSPTAERLAQYMAQEIYKEANGVEASVAITVEESPGSSVKYQL